jgi:hypothetical protein
LLVDRFLYYFLTYSGEEEEDPLANVAALTSTSRTLVLSETRPVTAETSPPQDIRHPTPVASPRAPSPKRARVEPGKESSLLTGSSATPPMDDVSALPNFYFAVELFPMSFFSSLLLFSL